MLKEDTGIELFLIEHVILFKKLKQLLGYLQYKDRIGIQIMSNLVYSQIYSSLDTSILLSKLFYTLFWTEEITTEIEKLVGIIHINH